MKTFKTISKLFIVLFIIFILCGCESKVSEKLSAKNDKNISFGTWNDNTYTNDFLEVSYTLPDGWTKQTDEEILKTMELGSELMNDKGELTKKLADLTSVTYLIATDPLTGNNAILMSEKPLIGNVSLDKYVESLKNNLKELESIDYEIGKETKEVINDLKYSTLELTAKYNDVVINQKYFVRKNGKYFISTIITSTTGTDNISNIISNFKKL